MKWFALSKHVRCPGWRVRYWYIGENKRYNYQWSPNFAFVKINTPHLFTTAKIANKIAYLITNNHNPYLICYFSMSYRCLKPKYFINLNCTNILELRIVLPTTYPLVLVRFLIKVLFALPLYLRSLVNWIFTACSTSP